MHVAIMKLLIAITVSAFTLFAQKETEGYNDSEIMSEYSEYMQKATDLAKKLEKCKGDMSSTQIQRMVKIQSRMAEAI